jgi:hypothetical protein
MYIYIYIYTYVCTHIHIYRSIPLWGLSPRGLYQALCVQTLAISTQTPDTTTPTKTRTFHFHIRKIDMVEKDEKRNKGDVYSCVCLYISTYINMNTLYDLFDVCMYSSELCIYTYIYM